MTPDDLRQLAAARRAEGHALMAADRIEEAAEAFAAAIRAERTADQLETRLTGKVPARTVHTGPMLDAHRAALGTSRPGHASRFRRWIANAEGKRPHKPYSLRSLAAAVPTSASTLSQGQRPKGDPLARPIRPDIARRVEKLTGWPADDAHWPAGLQED